MKKRTITAMIIGFLFLIALVAFCSYPSERKIAEDNTEIVTVQLDTLSVDTLLVDTVVMDTIAVAPVAQLMKMNGQRVSEKWLRSKLMNHGITGDNLERFVYIAKRESSLNPKAYNTTLNKNKTTDTGLFQINSCHVKLHEKYDLFDPEQNILAALELYKQSGFRPWFTLQERKHYNEGNYDQRMWRDYVPQQSRSHLIAQV